VIAGAGTVGLEILEDVPGVDTVVVSSGGGGLVAGIAAVCVPAGVRVVAVEPERSNALQLGIAAGKPVPLTPETIADGLTAPFAGVIPIALCRARRRRELVTEGDQSGVRSFTSAPSSPPSRPRRPPSRPFNGRVDGETVVVVVSGGNVSAETASAILAGR
jgi:threonine dehydratase